MKAMKSAAQTGIVLSVIFSLLAWGCASPRPSGGQEAPSAAEHKGAAALPYAMVYRTRADYSNNVPVTLSADGERILSYPDPRDLTSRAIPLALHKGYLLDRRGISVNTAFLDYTYEEYARLQRAPSAEELLAHIVARNAIVELYRLPVTLSAALANPALCSEFVDNGFKGCMKIK